MLGISSKTSNMAVQLQLCNVIITNQASPLEMVKFKRFVEYIFDHMVLSGEVAEIIEQTALMIL